MILTIAFQEVFLHESRVIRHIVPVGLAALGRNLLVRHEGIRRPDECWIQGRFFNILKARQQPCALRLKKMWLFLFAQLRVYRIGIPGKIFGKWLKNQLDSSLYSNRYHPDAEENNAGDNQRDRPTE